MFADTIFVLKQVLLLASVFCVFGTLKFFGQSLLSTVIFMLLGSFSPIMYGVVYERGYVASVAMDDIKMKLLRATAKSGGRKMALLVQRQIRSVYNEGVRVGQFCVLDRLSTLTFIEFMSTKVASLMIVARG